MWKRLNRFSTIFEKELESMRYLVLTPTILLAAILSMSMNRAIASQQEAAQSKFDDWLLIDGEDQQKPNQSRLN